MKAIFLVLSAVFFIGLPGKAMSACNNVNPNPDETYFMCMTYCYKYLGNGSTAIEVDGYGKTECEANKAMISSLNSAAAGGWVCGGSRGCREKNYCEAL